MKAHLVKTISISLLLSFPVASHALPGDLHHRRDLVNAEVAALQAAIAKLKAEKDAKEAELKDAQKRLPILEAYIQSLEGIQNWKKENFKECKTITHRKSKKATPTVAKSDKSEPYFIKEEQPRTWGQSMTGLVSAVVSLGHSSSATAPQPPTHPTIKVITVPAGKGFVDTLPILQSPTSSTSSSSSSSATPAPASDEKQ